VSTPGRLHYDMFRLKLIGAVRYPVTVLLVKLTVDRAFHWQDPAPEWPRPHDREDVISHCIGNHSNCRMARSTDT